MHTSPPPPPDPSVIDAAQALRARAEDQCALTADHLALTGETLSPEVAHLLHELQVHQVGLEMQNNELRRARTTIDNQRARYFDLYDLAPVGYLTVNPGGLILEANLTAATLLGLPRSALTFRLLHTFIEKTSRQVWHLQRQALIDQGEPQTFELRLTHPDGSQFWVLALASRVTNELSNTEIRLALTNITEQKQARDKLQLAANVFSHAHEGILITDAHATIIEVNEAFCRITGYSRIEVLGQNPRILASGRHDQPFYAMLWNELISHGYWCGEIWNRRKNGELYTELLAISAVRDPAGAVGSYVALFSDITAQKKHTQQIDHMAHFDALTNLPNRLLLADRLQQTMLQARRSGHPLAVVYLDLDGFKAINDRFGHAAGDSLLMAVANNMQSALREGDTLARVGSDEFAAVLSNLDSVAACLPLLERLLQAVAQPLLLDGKHLQVSASLGVSYFPQVQEIEADPLLRQADQAMYQAKQSGKNRYHIFDTVQDASLRGWHEDLYRVKQALTQHEFVLFYQPKVNLRTGQVVGFEALIRWQHPDKGLLAPVAFLPVIENHALAIDVGEWVIDTALGQMAQWQAQGIDLPVSVNVGASQLQQPNFVAHLQALLASHPQVNPTQLELEILETSALQDMAYVSQVIEDCDQMGVRFALDDFGTGYSSLTYLKRLRVALLKIDQSFVRNMLTDPDDRAILEGVIGLARAFKREVIAEGVETTAHGALLLQLGCDLAQGYGIARPMPVQEVPGWLAHWPQDGA